jgi:phosphate acetyltransferase
MGISIESRTGCKRVASGHSPVLNRDMTAAQVMASIYKLARQERRKVVLPEGTDARILRAALDAKELGLADPVVLGDPKLVRPLLKQMTPDESALTLGGGSAADFETLGIWYHNRRQGRDNTTLEDARSFVCQPLYQAACMVGSKQADAMVAGAVATTAEVLRAALRCIGLKQGVSSASSYFIMCMPGSEAAPSRVLLFADCAVVVEPTPEQLAEIAVITADTGAALLGLEPRIAMLSFSTHGSAQHEAVTRVRQAAKYVQELRPDLLCDGELQLDAALVPTVAARKARGSPVAGQANILVFPNLDAGNIGYKLVQRLAGATAIGPLLQGFAQPVNDLSRGCSVEDIVHSIAVTAAEVNLRAAVDTGKEII